MDASFKTLAPQQQVETQFREANPMLPRTTTLWACVLAAGSATAQADIFTWFANSGMWENPAMWNGPAGQYPDSILDTATISGTTTTATLGQNLAIGTLNVINGAAVNTAGNSIFVNADTVISGIGSTISVTESPSLRDFDTDTLTLDNDGALVLYDGLAQFDEALNIHDGAVLGTGTIEMNSTTGNLVLGEGLLWTLDGSGTGDGLLITRTANSTARLDWTSSDAGITIWDGKSIHNQLPYEGSLGGRIWVAADNNAASFISDEAIVASLNAEFKLQGSSESAFARIEAPIVDTSGRITVSSYAEIDSPIVAIRGEIELSENATLSLPATLLRFDSLNITATGPNSGIRLEGNNSSLDIIGGTTTINLGIGGNFDLDGLGDKVVNIDDGSTLSFETEFLDTHIVGPFNGTFNIEGALHVEPVNGRDTWNNYGEINLTQGEITGRGIINNGIIRGTGSIEGSVNNNGEIIADGGTLQLGQVTMDGQANAGTGVIRAQTGDMIMNMQADGGDQYFTGSIYVGDGIGVREVLNADVNLWLREIDGVRGSMNLNSGFVAFNNFLSYGDVTVDGDSILRVTDSSDTDQIWFSTGSVTTINGTLQADGNTWFAASAQVNGSGTLDMVSTQKSIHLQNGSDLGGVSLITSGEINPTDLFYESTASMHALTMRNTASFNASMYYAEKENKIVSDKLIVQDHAILDGTLTLVNFPASDLPAGETVTILEAASIEGEFDAIDYSALGANRRAFVTITDTTVDVFVTCLSDLNADGEANFFDASEFINLYNQQDPMADLNEDGQHNFFDVSAFLSAFDLGC